MATPSILDAYREHLEDATEQERIRGRLWYPAATSICKEVALKHGHDWRRVALAMAALSPRVQWNTNIRATWDIAAGRRPRGPFRLNIDKARDLLERGDSRTLGGAKVRSFAAAILGYKHAACIDTWMLVAAGVPDVAKAFGQPRTLRACREALAALARETGEDVRDIQAIIWLVAQRKAETK